jgi:UDP-3-O-[3-hydroxymyristoyl] glucosamine N-acyltransferase
MKKKHLPGGLPLNDIYEALNVPLQAKSIVKINGLCPYEQGEIGCIAFCSDTNVKRIAKVLNDSNLAALLVNSNIETSELPQKISYLKVADPMRAFIQLVPLFYEPYPTTGAISKSAVIHPSASIGKGVTIGDFVSIGANCVIGDFVTIHAQVVLYPDVKVGGGTTIHAGAIIRERCEIGEQVIIQNGAIIGADGFGYIPDKQDGVRAVPQVGIVSLAPRVEVGANSCIDRGAFGMTQIGLATKIDNLVQIGHNVRIGKFSFICGQAAIAGSAVLGNQVTIGGNSGVAGHLEISDNIRVAGNSGVTSSLDISGDYGGFPAQPATIWRRQVAALRRLPERLTRLRKAEPAVNGTSVKEVK